MVQNECQRMTKTEFYSRLRQILSGTYDQMQTLKKASEFLNTMDGTTLNDMSVPAAGADEGLRTTLSNVRTAINEILDFYDGTATTQTQVLKTHINDLRHLI